MEMSTSFLNTRAEIFRALLEKCQELIEDAVHINSQALELSQNHSSSRHSHYSRKQHFVQDSYDYTTKNYNVQKQCFPPT